MSIDVVIPVGPGRDGAPLDRCLAALAPQCAPIVVHGGSAAENRNAGIAQSKAARVLFLDSDCIAPSDLVAIHGRATGAVIGFRDPDPRNTPRVARACRRGYGSRFAWTCHVSYPRAALLEVGGFDERFRLSGFEDLDLAVRLTRAGLAEWWALTTHRVQHIEHGRERGWAEAQDAGREMYRATLAGTHTRAVESSLWDSTPKLSA